MSARRKFRRAGGIPEMTPDKDKKRSTYRSPTWRKRPLKQEKNSKKSLDIVKRPQWRSEGGRRGVAAPGRRPEGGTKILPKNLKNII